MTAFRFLASAFVLAVTFSATAVAAEGKLGGVLPYQVMNPDYAKRLAAASFPAATAKSAANFTSSVSEADVRELVARLTADGILEPHQTKDIYQALVYKDPGVALDALVHKLAENYFALTALYKEVLVGPVPKATPQGPDTEEVARLKAEITRLQAEKEKLTSQAHELSKAFLQKTTRETWQADRTLKKAKATLDQAKKKEKTALALKREANTTLARARSLRANRGSTHKDHEALREGLVEALQLKLDRNKPWPDEWLLKLVYQKTQQVGAVERLADASAESDSESQSKE